MLIEHVLPAYNMNLFYCHRYPRRRGQTDVVRWNFPGCCGPADGKQRSGNTGSSFVTAEERTVLHYLR
jgi:hypothetical protein